jgi:hypothetical protein
VRGALQMSIDGVLLMLAGLVGFAVSEALTWDTRHVEGRTLPPASAIFLCLLGAGVVLYLGGQGLSCLAPATAKVRGLSIASLVSLALAAATGVIAVLWFVSWEKLPGAQPPWRTPLFLVVAVVAAVAGMVGQTLAVLVLRRIADFLDNKPLAKNLLRSLLVFGVVLLAVIGLEVMAELMAQKPGGDRGGGQAAFLAEAVLAALALAWFALLVYQVRRTVLAEIQAHVNHPPGSAPAP